MIKGKPMNLDTHLVNETVLETIYIVHENILGGKKRCNTFSSKINLCLIDLGFFMFALFICLFVCCLIDLQLTLMGTLAGHYIKYTCCNVLFFCRLTFDLAKSGF